jgi:hypothetical protein
VLRGIERLLRSVEDALGARQPFAHNCQPARVACGDLGDGGLQERLLAEVIAVAPVRVRRAHEQRHVIAASQRLRIWYLIPQLECALEERCGLAIGVYLRGRVAGADAGGERGGPVPGRVKVVRDPSRNLRVSLAGSDTPLERVREHEVELGALARQQVVDDHFAEQRVPEDVAVVGAGHDQVVRNQLTQRRKHGGALDSQRVGDKAIVEPLPDGDQPQQLLRAVVEPLDPHHEGVTQRAGHRASAVGAAREQLLDEQGIAFAAREQAVDELALGRPAEDVRERFTYILPSQSAELNTVYARLPLDLSK